MAQVALSAGGALAMGAAFPGGTFLGVTAGSWGWMIGSIIGNLLHEPKGLHIEGPRLNDKTYSGNSEGADMPILWGGGRLTGRPIWLAPTRESKVTSSSGGGKGGGAPEQKQTTYYYYQSFAVSFGQFSAQPRRIWLNKSLVVDNSGSNTSTVTSGVKYTVYTPDNSGIDSLIEQDVGEGNCPSFKGQTVIVFDDLPLEKYGNRVPTVEAEFWDTTNTYSNFDIELGIYYQGSVQAIYPENILRHPTEDAFITSVSHNFTAGVNTHPIYYTNMAARDAYVLNETALDYIQGMTWDSRYDSLTGISYKNYPRGFFISETDSGQNDAVVHHIEYPSGKFWATSSWAADGGVLLGEQSAFMVPCGVRNLSVTFWLASKSLYGLNPGTSHNISTLAGTSQLYSSVMTRTCTCIDWQGNRWGFVGKDANKSSWEYFTMQGSTVVSIVRQSSPFDDTNHFPDFLNKGITGADFAFHIMRGFYVEETNEIWFGWVYSGANNEGYNAGIVMLDADDGSVIDVFNPAGEGYDPNYNSTFSTWDGADWFDRDPQTNEIFFAMGGDAGVMSINIYSKVRTQYSGVSTFAGPVIHYQGRNSFWRAFSEYRAPDYEFVMQEKTTFVPEGQTSVGAIIADICQRVGLELGEIDTSDLTSTNVYGFVHGRNYSARSAIEVLLTYSNADGYQSDNKLKFRIRGDSTDETLDVDYLSVSEINGPLPTYQDVIVRKSDPISIPKVYELRYTSLNNILNTGIAASYFGTGDSNKKVATDLAILMTDAQAADVVTRMHNQMQDTTLYEFSLPIRYANLEPTDIVVIPVNGVNTRVRLTAVERGANFIMKCKAISDAAEFYVSNAAAVGSEAYLANIETKQPFRTEIIDVTLLRDGDNDHPGPYLISYIYGSNPPPANYQYSVNDINYFDIGSQVDQPYIGYVAEAISETVWEEWDDTTTITVVAYTAGKTLSSSTKAAIEADQTINAFAYGAKGRWELLNAATITLVEAGKYILSNLLRGRRGTNNFMGLHEEKDVLIELDSSYLTRHVLQNSQLDGQFYYKTLRNDQNLQDVVREDFIAAGAMLKPYSPIQIAGVDDAGDIDITWTRRTRKGGSLGGDNTLTDGVGGAINEDTETYEIDIVNSTSEAVIGTYSVSASTAYTYTVAQQASDGSDKLGTFSIDVYQISGIVGRGYRGRGEYDRGWGFLINALFGVGAGAIVPLDDATTSGNVKDWVSGSTTFGTCTNISTGRSVCGENFGSIVKNGTGYVKCGIGLTDVLSGSNGGTVVICGTGNATDSGYLIELTSKGNRERFRVYFSSATLRSGWAPKLDAVPSNYLWSSLGSRENGVTWMIICTCDLNGVFNHTGWINNERLLNQVQGTGHSSYASTFQDQTRDTNYNDTISGTTDASPSQLAAGGGLTGFVAVIDKKLSDTEIGNLFAAHREGVTSLYMDDNTCQTYNQFDYPSGGTTTWVATKGYDFTNSGAATGLPSISAGSNYSLRATTQELYRTLPSDWKVQDFTISILFKPYDAPTATQVIIAMLPIDWNGSAKKGLRITTDVTNGLGYELGTGAGTFTSNNSGTANMSYTGAIYHVCLTVDSTGGVVLYRNGVDVANSGGTPVTIDWTDGTPGVPTTATCYINNDDLTNPGNEGRGYYNDFGFFTRALSAAEVLTIFRRSTGVVV